MTTDRPAAIDLIFPRPVLVTLAGTPWKASELTFGDLATLQNWLRLAAPDPMAGLPPAGDPKRPDALRRAWHAAKRFPPLVGGGDGMADLYLATPEGRTVFLVLALGPWNEDFDAELAGLLAEEMTADDWQRLNRVAYNVPAWRELAMEMDPGFRLSQSKHRGEDTDWARILVSVARNHNLDFATLADWTPTQLRLFCAEGELTGYRSAMMPGESRDAFVARMIETFRMPGSPTGG
jgi:hypothetical protein